MSTENKEIETTNEDNSTETATENTTANTQTPNEKSTEAPTETKVDISEQLKQILEQQKEQLELTKALKEENDNLKKELDDFKTESKKNAPIKVRAVVKGRYDYQKALETMQMKSDEEFKEFCRNTYDRINNLYPSLNKLV